MGISMTKEELAQIAGYSYRQLYNINKELDEDSKIFVKSEGKGYDLALFVQRWVAYKVDEAKGDGDDLDKEKAIHERIKTRKTALEVKRLEGTLVDIGDVRKLWADVANTIMQSMLHLPSTIAPMVTMMDNHEVIARIIDEEIRKVLTLLSETPVPDYAAEGGEEDLEV